VIAEIKYWIRYWMTVRFLKLVCRYYKVELEKTNVWKELHSAYNPIVSLSVSEAFFEDAFMRTPLKAFATRNKRLFFYMHRMKDIDPTTYTEVFASLSKRQQKKLYKAMGMHTRMGMLFFTIGYWSGISEDKLFNYPGQ